MPIPNTGYLPQSIEGVDGIVVSQTGGHVRVSGSGIPDVVGRTFYTELTTDETITTAAPTAPFAYGPGQPTVLLSMTESVRAGRTLVRANMNGYLFNDDPQALGNGENQPFADIFIYVDGVQIGKGSETFFYQSVLDGVEIMPIWGPMEFVVDLPDAPAHTFEIRWGVSGSEPAATASVLPASQNVHYATLVVQELAPS